MNFDYESRKFLNNLEQLMQNSGLPLTALKYILVDIVNQLNSQIEYNIAHYEQELAKQSKEEKGSE